jgi:tRNA(fMet)-specific endonuclease VapC
VDTDVFSYSLKGDTRAEVYKKHLQGKLVALSFVTVGELQFWAIKRKWGARRLAELSTRLRSTVIVPYDLAICETYGNLRAKLEALGKKVADNDLWIAACAIRHSIPLVSNNRTHFEGIPDLILHSEAPVVAEIQSQGSLKEIPGFIEPT